MKLRFTSSTLTIFALTSLAAFGDTPQFVVYQKNLRAQFPPAGLTRVQNLSSDGRLFLAKENRGASFVMSARSNDYIVEPNVQFFAITPQKEAPPTPKVFDDEFFGLQWALKNLGQEEGVEGADIDYASLEHAPPVIDKNVRIAIVDSGVDKSHPDLQRMSLSGTSFVAGESQSNALIDLIGHGTHIAGVIGASADNLVGIAGIVNAPHIESFRVFGESGGASLTTIIEGIEAARQSGAKIVNLSLGAPTRSQILEEIMRRAGDDGILFVTAAGNESSDLAHHAAFPANYKLPNQIVVGASNRRDELAGLSNFGAEQVDIAAPGEHIVSTYLQGNYMALSGTSMATPHVTAAAALLLQREPGLTPVEIKARIMRSATVLPSLQGKVRNAGRLSLTRLFNL